jgi:uncharacterized metal-binding protein YceD (DUF177 family)
MSDLTPEFSRLVPLARLGSAPISRRIEATADEREGLARRFDLLTLDRLTATVTLRRRDARAISLDAVFEAAFAQTCVLTLEPLAGEVSRSFSLLYGSADGAETEIGLGAEDPAFEPLTGDAIDIGEAVAQELSLALPEFPHHPAIPSADAIDVATADAIDMPFAELARLRNPEQD